LAEIGLSAAPIESRAEVRGFTSTDADKVKVYRRSAAETFVKFMTVSVYGQLLSVVLIITFLLCLFIELSMPGVGVFGGAALVALGLLVLPHVLLGFTGWLLLAAVLVGVGLILVEVFIVPGFGVPGIAGLVLLMLGLVGIIVAPGSTTGADSGDYAYAGLMVLLALFAAGVGMYLFSRYTQYVPLANKLVLQDTSPRRDEFLSAMSSEPGADELAPAKPGQTGTAHTRLMPAGTAEIDGELVDAVAERGFIDQGEAVVVTSATRYRVTVAKHEPGAEVGDIAGSVGDARGDANYLAAEELGGADGDADDAGEDVGGGGEPEGDRHA
jgi:membrane-bound serine protease (ClpP class)